jgi:NTP pyrophosphatase (non-canonical NTP hydrolase)
MNSSLGNDINELTKLIVRFRDDRNWKQYHNPKDMALSLVLEASEVMEHFQWKNSKDIKNIYLHIKVM